MNLTNLELELKRIGRAAMSEQEEMPDDVLERLEKTLTGLPDRSRRVEWRGRRAAIATGIVAAVITILCGFSMLSAPAAAALRQVPIIGSVFGQVGDYGLRLIYEGKTSTKVQLSDSHKGITFHVRDVLYDGTSLAFGYYFDGADEGISSSNIRMDVYVNGKKTDFRGFGYAMSELNGYIWHERPEQPDSLPEKFDLSLKVSRVGDVKGNWSVTVPVEEYKEGRLTLFPNVGKSSPDFSLLVRKVRFSPTMTAVDLDVQQAVMENIVLDYVLEDDQGVEYPPYESTWSTIIAPKQLNKTLETSLLFGPTGRIPKWIKIKPFLPSTDLGEETKAGMVSPPAPDQPIVLLQGEAGKMDILSVEYFRDRTRVHYRVQGKFPFFRASGLAIEDSGGNRVNRLPELVYVIEDLQKSEFFTDFPPIQEKDIRSFVTHRFAAPVYFPELDTIVPVDLK
ncbi:DUF4179 domain-containing protein [Cohnella faecalis]|nr:DUF4179 domain-containing protein [Cohnella faecalis]